MSQGTQMPGGAGVCGGPYSTPPNVLEVNISSHSGTDDTVHPAHGHPRTGTTGTGTGATP
jgi:hypothetical protein